MRGGRLSVKMSAGTGRGRAGSEGRAMRRSGALGIVASIGAIALAASTLAACDPPIETPDPGAVAMTYRARQSSAPQPEVPEERLRYFGGSLLQNVEITPVQYGTWSCGDGSPTPEITKPALSAYLDMLVTSPYIDFLGQYDARGQVIGHGTVDAWTTITPAAINNTKTITNKKIQTELVNQITAGALPMPTPNRLYVLFFRSKQTISYGGVTSVNTFCAYHQALLTTINGQTTPVYYAVMPYEVKTLGCQWVYTPLGALTTTASHEIAEAITDPGAGKVSFGWLTKNQYNEIADICLGRVGMLGGFQVQALWSNADKACVVPS